jgi:hypothetical protein
VSKLVGIKLTALREVIVNPVSNGNGHGNDAAGNVIETHEHRGDFKGW